MVALVLSGHPLFRWASYVVVAAGQKPPDLEIAGAEHLTKSEQFLELDELPKRILFIGGGYIAFEFAHLAVRAGAQVTIVHRGPRPLPRFDPDLIDQLVKRTRELGVDVQLGTEVVVVEKSPGQLIVQAAASGEKRTFACLKSTTSTWMQQECSGTSGA